MVLLSITPLPDGVLQLDIIAPFHTSGPPLLQFHLDIEQWGANLHGWVIFPIPFSQFRRLVTNHQGKVFMDSKAVESNSLSGFTLDVRNNNDSSEDAQWIAIGC